MKGICFKEPLFHKVIEGTKTQTRRMITPQPEYSDRVGMIYKGLCYGIGFNNPKDAYYNFSNHSKAAKYKVGEKVYLKEPYILYQEEYQESKTSQSGIQYAYKFGNHLSIEEITGKSDSKWKNKLFMPESAARYFIEITAVRVERLQDISDEDCMKEGIEVVRRAGHAGENNPSGLCFDISQKWDYQYSCSESAPWKAYAALINKINGKGTWEKNPWVWVYDFELINK